MRERNQIAAAMDGVRKLEAEVADALELIGLAEAESDSAMVTDAMVTPGGCAKFSTGWFFSAIAI